MTSSIARRTAGVSVIAASLAVAAWAADTTVRAPSSSSTQKSTPARSGKGPLPDPTLLDGSSQAAEKKSEQGMIGDFELPGDENVKDGKVGGQSGAPGGKGGQQQPPGIQLNIPMPGLPSVGLPVPGKEQSGGMPSAGGAGLNIPDPTKQGAGLGQQGGPSLNIPTGADSGAGQQGGGAGQPPSGASGGADGKPGGVQVGSLQGEGSAAGQDAAGGGDGPNGKPAPIGIGDSAMRIEPSVNPGQLPGGQQGQIAGQTQQHEKGTGSGGKGSGGAQSGNRVERGKAMPAGL